MTSINAIPLTEVTLEQLEPGHSPSFSRNLFRWLRLHTYTCGLPVKAVPVADNVYAVRADSPLVRKHYFAAGELLVGSPCPDIEGDFSGALLMTVLSRGPDAPRMCYPNIMRCLEQVGGFWPRYLRIGRCAIDPLHTLHFSGNDRYAENHDYRTCLWCGLKQRRLDSTQTIPVENWVRYA
jgi:hypothetical protein